MTIETMAKAEAAYGPEWDTACGPYGVVGPTGQKGREGRSARREAVGLGGSGPLQQGTRIGMPPMEKYWIGVYMMRMVCGTGIGSRYRVRLSFGLLGL